MPTNYIVGKMGLIPNFGPVLFLHYFALSLSLSLSLVELELHLHVGLSSLLSMTQTLSAKCVEIGDGVGFLSSWVL